jgi:hypothetical protein
LGSGILSRASGRPPCRLTGGGKARDGRGQGQRWWRIGGDGGDGEVVVWPS